VLLKANETLCRIVLLNSLHDYQDRLGIKTSQQLQVISAAVLLLMGIVFLGTAVQLGERV